MPETTTETTEVAPETPEVNDVPVAQDVEAPVTIHDPVVMATEFRRQLKDFEGSLRAYVEILKSPNTIPLFDK